MNPLSRLVRYFSDSAVPAVKPSAWNEAAPTVDVEKTDSSATAGPTTFSFGANTKVDISSSEPAAEPAPVPLYLQPPRIHSHVTVDPASIDVVIYHGACFDGMGAAYAAWKLLGDKATYHPLQHKSPLPRIAGMNVALLDIAFPMKVLAHILQHAKSVVLVDHHISAEADVAIIPPNQKIFDMKRSGAALAWEYFHPGQPIPKFLLYVEDRDIWNWHMPFSKEFNAAFMVLPMTIANYRAVHEAGEARVVELIEAGKHMVEFSNRAFMTICNKATVRTWAATGHKVLVVNCCVFKSEVGNLMAERPGVDFALIWHYEHSRQEVWASLRSSNVHANAVDVSEIAKPFGGGVSTAVTSNAIRIVAEDVDNAVQGHAKASAFNFKGHIEDLLVPLQKPERAVVSGAPILEMPEYREQQLKKSKDRVDGKHWVKPTKVQGVDSVFDSTLEASPHTPPTVEVAGTPAARPSRVSSPRNSGTPLRRSGTGSAAATQSSAP